MIEMWIDEVVFFIVLVGVIGFFSWIVWIGLCLNLMIFKVLGGLFFVIDLEGCGVKYLGFGYYKVECKVLGLKREGLVFLVEVEKGVNVELKFVWNGEIWLFLCFWCRKYVVI